MSTSNPPFIPGIKLNGRFYQEIVRPLLDRYWPALPHAAALIGYGSDVLGFDTPMSTDHNWGPRLQLFLSEADFDHSAAAVDDILRNNLPAEFLGYSVHYTLPDPTDNGTQHRAEHSGGPVNHLLEITTVERYFRRYLGVSPDAPLSDLEWLALPEQKLLEVTAGAVYFDGLGRLGAARARFAYFPRPVWLCRLAAAWARISEEEPFMGRTGDLGDELGSCLIAARLARDLIGLAFLYSRRYKPYSKWLGTAFGRLPLATKLQPLLLGLVTGADWRSREASLVRALRLLAEEHNRQGITPPLATDIRLFFGRPFQVIMAGRFADAIAAELDDPRLRLAATTVGAVDQFSDCVAIHSDARRAATLNAIYALDA